MPKGRSGIASRFFHDFSQLTDLLSQLAANLFADSFDFESGIIGDMGLLLVAVTTCNCQRCGAAIVLSALSHLAIPWYLTRYMNESK
jgi:hypothetical protein